MPTLSVMTYNVENLFARFEFGQAGAESYLAVAEALDDPHREVLAKSAFNLLQEDTRIATALSIAEADPHVICLQEVDSLRALDYFERRFLRRVGRRRTYEYRYLIEGNDPRGIDVAILSRFKIESVTSHRDVMNAAGTARLFSRDCLEVQVRVAANKYLWVYANHLKSMMGGRPQTRARRVEQAQGIRDIVEERHANPAAASWLIAGDLNDYYHVEGVAEPAADHAFAPLDIGNWCIDLTAGLQAADRWSHYWAGEDEYKQLDYLLASPALAQASQNANPRIIRNGLPVRAGRFGGNRWPRIGYDRPKASDHCPVVVDVTV